MTKEKNKLYIEVKIAWWLKLYLFGVVMTALLTKLEPDWIKVHLTVSKAIKCKFTNKKPLKKFTA
jgi:hypothetical protein